MSSWTIVSRKYDGARHRLWTAAFPVKMAAGEAEWLPDLVFEVPGGTPIEERNGDRWSSDFPVYACFFHGKCYQVMVLCKDTGTEFYCNSCMIAEVDSGARVISYVDMDLDLIVDAHGHARVVDEDEFADHAGVYGYPADVVMQVRADLRELVAAAMARRGVFRAGLWRR